MDIRIPIRSQLKIRAMKSAHEKGRTCSEIPEIILTLPDVKLDVRKFSIQLICQFIDEFCIREGIDIEDFERWMIRIAGDLESKAAHENEEKAFSAGYKAGRDNYDHCWAAWEKYDK